MGASLVSRTRNAADAVAQANLPRLWGALSGAESAMVLGQAQVLQAYNSTKPRMYRQQFVAYMREKFPSLPPLPVLFVPLRGFMSTYVFVRGNKASNLSGVISALRTGTQCVDEWALEESEYSRVKKDAAWLTKMYPSAPEPVRELSTSERECFYRACAEGGAEGMLAMAILVVSVAAQMRFSETITLWEQDVVFGEHGILISVVLDKTHKTTLKPYPRVCARYPPFFSVHDAWPALHRYLKVYGPGAPMGAGPPCKKRPFFTKLVGVGAACRSSSEPLDAPYTKGLLERFLKVSVTDWRGALNLHCFRSTGFNDLANRMYLGRVNAAEAGGWTEGGCVAESYQRRSALDLSCSIYIEYLRVCALLGRDKPPTGTLGQPPG